MPILPSEVQPGDIISSELMTEILSRLSQLSDIVITGTQQVPNVIGMNLADARTQIQLPSRQLALGFVVNTVGAAVNPNAAANSNLIVLNQTPIAGHLAAINSSVNLVVSQSGGGSTNPDPAQQPVISGTETLGGSNATEFAVGENMVLVGNNFSANASQNIVTFDGVRALVSGNAADPTRRLFVEVPTGIPDGPVNPGDIKENVVVIVRHAISNLSATVQVDVSAPIPNSPTITSLSHSLRFEGQNLIITGTNFTAESVVTIRDEEAEVVQFTSTTLEIVVPEFDDIPGNAVVPASVVVNNPGVGSAIFSGSFSVMGVTN